MDRVLHGGPLGPVRHGTQDCGVLLQGGALRPARRVPLRGPPGPPEAPYPCPPIPAGPLFRAHSGVGGPDCGTAGGPGGPQGALVSF